MLQVAVLLVDIETPKTIVVNAHKKMGDFSKRARQPDRCRIVTSLQARAKGQS